MFDLLINAEVIVDDVDVAERVFDAATLLVDTEPLGVPGLFEFARV